jgi:hypothetical protein
MLAVARTVMSQTEFVCVPAPLLTTTVYVPAFVTDAFDTKNVALVAPGTCNIHPIDPPLVGNRAASFGGGH